MSIIYEPKGKAREYSPLALNIYMGCTHKCKYCYAPVCLNKLPHQYFTKPEPRKGIVENLKKELSKNRPTEQVLLSFIGDPYGETTDNNETTRQVLEILLDNKVPVAILTKSGKRCLKDIELFKSFKEHIQIGATLTFDNEKDSLKWESGAALPQERLDALQKFYENGIKTFISFEPVIDVKQSVNLIKQSLKYVDTYKIGKINNYQNLDKKINWTSFLKEVVDILRTANKQFYIKHDLRLAASSVRLYGNEVLMDEHCVR